MSEYQEDANPAFGAETRTVSEFIADEVAKSGSNSGKLRRLIWEASSLDAEAAGNVVRHIAANTETVMRYTPEPARAPGSPSGVSRPSRANHADAVRIVNALQLVNANLKAERDALQRRLDYILSPEAVEHAAEHAYLMDWQFGTWDDVSDDNRAHYLARARVFLGSLDREAAA